MRIIAIATVSLLASAAAVQARASSPFDGTWKTDASTASMAQKPDVFAIVNGTYSCSTCAPPRAFPADGTFHPVKDNPYLDEESAKVIDAQSFTYSARLHGKLRGTTTDTVSADGNTLTEETDGVNAMTGAKTHYSNSYTRVAAGPAGSHAASGTWQQTKFGASDNALTMTLKVDAKTITTDDPTGQHMVATFGGPAVTTKGDPTGIMTSAAMPAPDTIMLTDMKDGKIIDIFTLKVSADRKSLTATEDDKRHGEISTFTMLRQ